MFFSLTAWPRTSAPRSRSATSSACSTAILTCSSRPICRRRRSRTGTSKTFMLRLDTEVQYVKGVGPRRSSLLGSRNIRTVGDLLSHIPKSYQDRANFVRLDSLHPGQDAAIHARVYQSRMIQTRSRGGIFHAVLTDGTSFVHAKWFHGAYLHQSRTFSAGREVVMYGRVEL